MLLYLDESGDLGFDWSKKNTSKYFVISILVLHHVQIQQKFQTAVTRTLRNKINHPKSKRIVNELKGSNTHIDIKRYFYSHVPKEGWDLYAVVLNKARVYPHLQSKAGKKKLYNFMARFLLEKIPFSDILETVNLTVDRCKNTEEIKDFNCYIESHLQAMLPLKTRLYINHETSQANRLLQVVDMFCWGIARKHASQANCQWYQLFEEKICAEELYLKEKE